MECCKLLQINNCLFVDSLDFKKIKLDTSKWIINEFIITSKSIDKSIEKYLFHEVANQIYHFVWHTFCDWYIEFIKSNFENNEKSKETKIVSGWLFGEILKIIHPILPFISEKLWQTLFHKDKFLMLEKSTSYELIKDFNSSQNNILKIVDIISSVRNLRSELQIPYKKKINLIIDIKDNDLKNFLTSFETEIFRLLKVDKIIYEKIHNKEKSAFIVFSDLSILIPLQGVIDTNSEIEKLNKKRNSINQRLILVENKLNNDAFINKAPKQVVEEFYEQSVDLKSSIEKINQIINTIKYND